jgi:hypothetical protein
MISLELTWNSSRTSDSTSRLEIPQDSGIHAVLAGAASSDPAEMLRDFAGGHRGMWEEQT